MQFTVVANESNRELRWQGASYSGAHPVFFFTMLHHFLRAASGIRHQHGSESDAAHPGIVPIFAQGCHVNSQGSNVIFLRTAPYFLREGGMRQHFAHIMRQHTQQLVLDGVKCNSFSLSQTQPAEKSIFKGPLTKPDYLYRQKPADSIGAALHAVLPAAHPRKTALSDNRLRRCPVPRSYQNPRPGTQDDDGQVRPCADAADDLDAVYIGQPRSSSMMSGLWLVVIMIAVSHWKQSDIYSRGSSGSL